MSEMLVLVDEKDNQIGYEEKIKVHKNGELHRAFSIFIFNTDGEMLLQQRSKKKYHFGGLWTNACCSHPLKGEKMENALHRELKEEMGFDTKLKESFSFLYRAEDPDSGMIEHEIDHVFVGKYDGKPIASPEEIDDWKWVKIDKLREDLKNNPEKYSPWFKIAINKFGKNMEL